MIKPYLDYLKDNPKGYWFKTRLYGWGWTTVKWQGWLTIIIFITLLVLFAFKIDGENIFSGFFVPVGVLTVILVIIGYWKGEKPRWQEGLPEKYKNKK
jgi:L-asparagine transporter-like permease